MFALLAAIRSSPAGSATPGPSSPVPAATPELIRDVAPPVDYLPYPMWAVVTVGIVAGVVLLTAAYFIIKWALQKPPIPPPAPRTVALRALEELRAQVAALDAYQFSIRVSDVLRTYVEAQYRVPALEQTSPEFLAAIAPNPSFSIAERQLLEKFLEAVDAIKFGRVGGDAGVNEHLLERSISFVRGGAL